MVQSFADAPNADLFHGTNSKAARAIDTALWPIVRRKLDLLNAAVTLQDLRCHPAIAWKP